MLVGRSEVDTLVLHIVFTCHKEVQDFGVLRFTPLAEPSLQYPTAGQQLTRGYM